MDNNRRRFLKIAGGAALLAAGGKVVASKAVASGSSTATKTDGTQLAMLVDLRKLAGKNIDHLVRACHSEHNVPDFGNNKDEIKWIWSTPFENAFPEQYNNYTPDFLKGQQVPVLCNHCENPPCVRACPTRATFKRDDGIVSMDFHRCIGCRLCILACPYGSRSLNFRDPRPFIKEQNKDFPTRTKGVVEKCNFCVERLAVGKLPACVDACSDNELMFGDLNAPNSQIHEVLKTRYSVLRKPVLGTLPKVFYLV